MTNPIPISPLSQRNTRALLIQQQRVTRDGLPLPRLLQSPYIALVWALVLSTVVAALALGRIRVPRTVPGIVVSAVSAPDGLTPVLLLPPSVRQFIKPGQLAVIDTGGAEPMSLAIASIEPATPGVSSPRQSSASSLTIAASHDTSALVARLERCNRSHCLSLAAATRYTASAALGTRSLASFALPHS
jgi:hypothetical protein